MPDEGGELFSILKAAGVRQINRLTACKTFEEYRQMSAAHLNILTSPQDTDIAQHLQETLGIPWVCLGGIYDPAQLQDAYRRLGEHLGVQVDAAPFQNSLADRLRAAKEAVAGRSIAVEGDAELAKWLLQEGFAVESLRLNPHQGLTAEQRQWFEENARELRVEAAVKGGRGPGGGHGPGGPGRPGGGRGPGGPGRPGGGRPVSAPAPLKLGYAAAMAALDDLMGGAAR